MKTNKKIIYVVTSGEYSDYHIDAVFSTKGKAKGYLQQKGTGYRIEEYCLDEEVVKQNKLWCVAFGIDTQKLQEASICVYEELRDTCVIKRYFYPNELSINFYVDADSMDRAVKIASERFAAVKANDYIWLRLTRPYELDKYGLKKYEIFNVKTNEFIKK